MANGGEVLGGKFIEGVFCIGDWWSDHHAKGRGVQLRGASEDWFEVCFVGLGVRGNYTWFLVMFLIFMGFGGAEVRDVLKSFGGWQCKPQGAILMGKGGGVLTVCNTAVLKLCYWVL